MEQASLRSGVALFTGIIEALGQVRSLESGVLVLDTEQPLGPDPVQLGESIAVNGVCLTIVGPLTFDLSPETLARTSLGDLKPGSIVNLERSMRAVGRFGGHIVQGHVDATGEIVSIRPDDNSTVFRFRIPAGAGRYLIDKGSITIDGISLTVVDPVGDEFGVWVIPHTIAHTNLGTRHVGDRVNLEFDVLAKYVERLMRPR